MKSIWEGSLSFGLVSIPVKLYSAVQAHELGFTLLHSTCKTPLEYKRWCPHCQIAVPWTDVVKGIKLGGSQNYTVITAEKLKTLKPSTTDRLDIISCIDRTQLDPLYVSQHYYVQPAKNNEKAFFLLRKALEQKQLFAIGRFVLREKEHVVALEAHTHGMILSTLHFEHEIKPLKDVQAPLLSKKELELANQLINQLYSKTFTMRHFTDAYMKRLKKELERLHTEQKRKPTKKKPLMTKTKKHAHKQSSALIDRLQASLKIKPLPQHRTKYIHAKA